MEGFISHFGGLRSQMRSDGEKQAAASRQSTVILGKDSPRAPEMMVSRGPRHQEATSLALRRTSGPRARVDTPRVEPVLPSPAVHVVGTETVQAHRRAWDSLQTAHRPSKRPHHA
jgi:hypothetical protein